MGKKEINSFNGAVVRDHGVTGTKQLEDSSPQASMEPWFETTV